MKFANTEALPAVAVRWRAEMRRQLARRLLYGSQYSPESLAAAARSALTDQAVRYLWERLAAAGLVRLDTPSDDDVTLDDLAGDQFKLEHAEGMDGGMRRLKAEERAFKRRVELKGVCGLVGQFRIGRDEPWQVGDSIWGFVGDDWKANDHDIMVEAINALRQRLRHRCPCCRQAREDVRGRHQKRGSGI